MKAHAVLAGFVSLLLALALVACGGSDNKTNATATVPANGTASAGGSAAQTGPASTGPTGLSVPLDQALPDLAAKVSPSVVTVLLANSEGSGVIWDKSGNIVTNEHVIEGGGSIFVILVSGAKLPATLVAEDPLTDLAVIKVDKQDLPAATFNQEAPRTGTPVMAIGNPLGFESSATFGIISGENRSVPSGGQTPALVDLLQTDAAISPGNSGGALVDTHGQVVGLNVAYIPPNQSAVSIGFAIPSATVVNVVTQLLTKGKVEHAFLGIEPRPLTPPIAQQLGLDVTQGVFVFGLTPGGPAEKAGVQTGDVIVEFDGKPVTSVEDLYAALRTKAPGDTVALTVDRDGQKQTMQVTLQQTPA